MSTTAEPVVAEAWKNFGCGYNCAQSILLALYKQIEPDEKNELVPKIAAGFGGGLGRCGSVCGAVTATIMAVGIKYGSNEVDPEKQAKVYAYSSELFKQFEKQHGTVYCRDLIKCDLSKPEELAKARREKVFDKACVNLIKTAITDFLELEK